MKVDIRSIYYISIRIKGKPMRFNIHISQLYNFFRLGLGLNSFLFISLGLITWLFIRVL